MEYTIKTIESTDTKKDGSKLIGKFGPYWLVRAELDGVGKVTWFSKTAHTQNIGDKITGTITETESNGYKNKTFNFPKKTDGVDPEAFIKLSNRVTKLEMAEDRRDQEFKDWLRKLKDDIVIETTGKINLRSDLEASDKNMEEVKDFLGIDDFEEPEF